MKKIAFILTLFFILSRTNAQNYPPYHVNVCTPASKGYYFMDAITISFFATGNPTHIIMDSTGHVIYYCPLANGGGDFKIQPNGLMTYVQNNKFFMMDSTFTIIDSVECQNGLTTDGHDLQILPNGHFLLLGTEVFQTDLSMYHMFGPNHTNPGSVNANLKCGVIQELDSARNVVFEWHTHDHFNFIDVDTNWLYTPNVVDWTHCNAIELDDDGNFLLSMRHFNEITKIKRADSSIVWRLGGNANQFSFPNDPNMFKGQHDIRRIDNGNITIWDNGNGSPFHVGSAKEYALNETNHIATLAWNYIENPNSFSVAIGDVQRLPDGNTLIDYGVTNTEPRLFDVVDPSGTIVFELQFDDTLRSYRVFNYQSMPWKFPRPQISCVQIGNQFYLDAGSGYSSYLWSTGDITQMIPVTSADTFSVFVPIGNGGFILSEDLIVTDTTDPCGLSTIHEHALSNSFSIYPNPANHELHVGFRNTLNERTDVTIFNALGELVFSGAIEPGETSLLINTGDLPNGIYLIRVNNETRKFVKSE